MAGQRNPELQRVLAALNGYSQSSERQGGSQDGGTSNEYQYERNVNWPPQNPSFPVASIPGLGYLAAPVDVPKPITPPPIQRRQVPSQPSRTSTPQQGDTGSKPSTPTVPDASTLTTWPAALKHVTRYIVPDEKVSTRIKHLINEQHKHERQWWAGREAIIARQEGRTGASQQVADLLKSLGGKTFEVAPADPKANKLELEAYDKKVYAGLLAMTADFDWQLRNMGVPFYAIKHDLVVLEEGPEKAGAMKGRIDKGELRELQQRMLQTLEDLFAD